MNHKFEIYDGDCIVSYTETDEKKQQLWDKFIEWCRVNNATSGESIQMDDFVINAPLFMSDCIDDIVKFDIEFKI